MLCIVDKQRFVFCLVGRYVIRFIKHRIWCKSKTFNLHKVYLWHQREWPHIFLWCNFYIVVPLSLANMPAEPFTSMAMLGFSIPSIGFKHFILLPYCINDCFQVFYKASYVAYQFLILKSLFDFKVTPWYCK